MGSRDLFRDSAPWIFSVSTHPHPVRYEPLLQNTCHYNVSHIVKLWHNFFKINILLKDCPRLTSRNLIYGINTWTFQKDALKQPLNSFIHYILSAIQEISNSSTGGSISSSFICTLPVITCLNLWYRKD